MEVTLVIVKADGTTRDFPLTAQRTVIGRQNTCGLRIPLHSVSRKHCELQMLDDQLVVRDLGSSNGTQINDQRVSGKAKLTAGDRLQLGPVVFTVTIDGYPEVVDASMTLIHQAQQIESQTMESTSQRASAKSDSRHVLSTAGATATDKQAMDNTSDIYDLSSDPANSGINRSQDSKSGSSSVNQRAEAADSALADLDALLLNPPDVNEDDDEILKMLDADEDPLANLKDKAAGKPQSPPTAIEGANADASAETAQVHVTPPKGNSQADLDDDDDPLASLEAMTDGLFDDDDEDLFTLDDSDLN